MEMSPRTTEEYLRARRRRRKRNSRLLLIIVILCAIAAAIIGWFVINRYFIESKERMSPDKYFNNEKLKFSTAELKDNEAMIIVNGEQKKSEAIIQDGIGYLALDFVSENFNSRFYPDKETNGVIYTNGKGTAVFYAGSKEYTDNSGEKVTADRSPIVSMNGKFYIDSSFLAKYTKMTAVTSTAPNRVSVNYGTSGWKTAEARSDTRVRYYAGIKSMIVTDIKKGENVQVLGNESGWTKVFTPNGYIGYVKESSLNETGTADIKTADEDTFTHIALEGKVSLAWLQVSNKDANANAEKLTEGVSDLDIVAPTWYSFADNVGTINDFSSAEVVNSLHSKGYKVWPVVNDFTSDVDIEAILSSKTMRSRMITRLMEDAKYMKYDGINVDFETIKEGASDDFLQFIRELSVECRKNGIMLSVDDYPPRRYNAHYDMGEQAAYADYIVLMNYDEHYAGSEEIGSVSSIGFVNTNLDLALKYVSSDRLINALPLYTRVWGTNAEGKRVSSDTAAMTTSEDLVKNNNGSKVWDEKTGQNIASYSKDGIDYKIWMEDARSLQLKIDAGRSRNIAGIAFWRLGYDTADVWRLVSSYKN
ncbi:MAG: glycosyl hydrolase family 18 protein [Clostridiales bacterium]|nr:glycosyl hydrolase family 18 protein [Clostridiales bacterium]MDU1042604.1 glycosyl hydrolase family 18 protein [Clostridiales bacterium]MDU3490354.1 glycosyl hydrolase family 18 protein [Clostridiales bacterium]